MLDAGVLADAVGSGVTTGCLQIPPSITLTSSTHCLQFLTQFIQFQLVGYSGPRPGQVSRQ